jgi:hypothetical protein
MPEAKTIVFNHKEVAKALVKEANIHDGFWQIYVEFAISAANIAIGPDQFSPAAIVPITKIGLMKMEQEAPLTIDASRVNPK